MPMSKKKEKRQESLERQDGDRFRYLLQPFLSYAFVCIYLEQRRQKQTIKERQNKTQNEDEIHLFEAQSTVRINSKLFLHAAEDSSYRTQGEGDIIEG